jgi:hypothetical protein
MSTLAPPIEVTFLAKSGGPLTKRIFLDANGKLVSDGSPCVMSTGAARRVRFNGLPEFATGIASLGQNEALALGTIRADLPNEVEVVTKRKLDELNGMPALNVIARTASHIHYRPNQPAPVLLDYDTKQMPHAVAARLDELGGYWPALVAVVPELASVAHVARRSTSAGLFRTDTGERLPGSSGLHVYLVLKDGSDAERFLKTLHARCWLAGLGWQMVGAGGNCSTARSSTGWSVPASGWYSKALRWRAVRRSPHRCIRERDRAHTRHEECRRSRRGKAAGTHAGGPAREGGRRLHGAVGGDSGLRA